MGGHGDKWSRKKELAVAALLSEPTVEAAAAKAGVSYPTLKRWLTMPDFQAAHRAARRAVLEGTVSRLVKASTRAVSVLIKNLKAKNVNAANRAAELILIHAHRGLELLDLTQEYETLRHEIEELKNARHSETQDGQTPPGIEETSPPGESSESGGQPP